MDKKIRIENNNLVSILRLELEKNSMSEDNILVEEDFTQEELDSITELSICYTNVGDIKELEKLKNLIKLSIISENSSLYAKFENGEIDEESYYFREKTNIEDFGILGKLKSIEELRIESEENLSKLDVTNLKKLKK